MCPFPSVPCSYLLIDVTVKKVLSAAIRAKHGRQARRGAPAFGALLAARQLCELIVRSDISMSLYIKMNSKYFLLVVGEQWSLWV
jgi:hypothetical protein